MAEVTVSEGKSLDKLEQEITCGICQKHYEEPKILPCLHYYCKQCVLGLVLKAGAHKPFSCPECRHKATLPEGGVDEMKTAFFINRLKSTVSTMEIAHGKVEMKCEACLEEPRDKAEAFCRQCAMFICKDCIKSHKRTRVLSNHQITSLDDLKEGRSNLAVEKEIPSETCSYHDEPLAIYCKDCNCLICRDCIMKDHKEHNFEFCKKAAPNIKKEILNELENLKALTANVSQAVNDVQMTKKEIKDQAAAVATQIQTSFVELQKVLNKHEKQLLEQTTKIAQDKLDHLTVQEKKLSLAGAEIQSVVDYTEQCVRHCTDNEVMSLQVEMKNRIQQETKRHSKMTMKPVEEGDIGVETMTPDALQQSCCRASKIIKLPIDPSKLSVTMKIPEVYKPNEAALATLTLSPVLTNNKPTNRAYEVVAYLKSLHSGTTAKCNIVKTDANKYSIRYTPTMRGRHKLTVWIDKQDIPGSPFPVFVSISPTQLGKPVKVWDCITRACAITVNFANEIIVTEYQGDILKLDEKGTHTLVRKSQHSLKYLCGIAADSENYIYCTDKGSNKILKCDKNGRNIKVHETKPEKGRGHMGMAVVRDEVMVCEAGNTGTIGVYNKDLQHIKYIKRENCDTFHDVSADCHDNLYAVTAVVGNSYIIVFKNDGTQSSFCHDKNGTNRLDCPHGVHVSHPYVYAANHNSNTIAVFTTDGEYVTSFGSGGEKEGQFKNPYSICIDKDGFLYVTDYTRNRVQCF